ncbi:beta-N-acetylhexosaminidase [Algibacter lectus]|uniref:beta-N-acetylhexosaminidase n=1 Tax=Algibacter lectus TaxID=221126 RepID=A0A090VHM1_9FLAO|nr:beta-N-acetylhexosaminidase [Algibacter lectus]MWW25691.1 family 20 glycosylhydrolase [Algibacter lectus]TDY60971.1 hexosaminidase [Algibacter lectus]GAL64280.1 beta-hexosaminidase [Algibacter lectus]
MKNTLLIALCIIVSACSNKYAKVINAEADYHIIPKPTSLKISEGRFLLDKNTVITAETALENEGQYLSEMLSTISGKSIPFSKETQGNILLKLDETIENNEGYTLSVSYNQITITGKTSAGVFYGIQTLSQLIPLPATASNTQTEVSIPATSIVDSPKFVYRGMHLDVARHFFPVSFVKKYIDILAMHKMNTFHWHLTEDQGWRIEIKKYPKLTSIGSIRKETIVGHGNTWNKPDVKYDGKPYGGFYTQEDIKEVVAYAETRHITIIPEIELPGHSLAAITAYPELGNTGEQYEVGKRWGVFPEIYAPSEETFKFLEDVLTEVIALFPSKLIHIGGDEAPKKQWEASKLAQDIIKREGLKDEHELQSYFIRRIEKFLNSKGRNIIGWDEILEGGLAPNATVMSWRGEKGGIQAAKMHHNVVMTPTRFCYFDFYQTKDRTNEPLAIGGNTSVEQVYSYNPLPKELTKEEQKYILGAQANVWTEYIKTPEQVEYMVLPRLTALSEVVWSSYETKDWNDFQTRLIHLTKRYEALGLNYAKHSLEIKTEK